VMRKLHVRLPMVENKHVHESSHVGRKTASCDNKLRSHATCTILSKSSKHVTDNEPRAELQAGKVAQKPEGIVLGNTLTSMSM